jgi:cardiolipin synthase
LLEAGIEIYSYDKTMLHQKLMIVDGIWSTVGTTNFDNRSFALNDENNVAVYDRAFAAGLQQDFVNDLAVCRKLDYEGWRNRGAKARLMEIVAVMLKEQV